MNILFANSVLSSFTCHSNECLSWIIIAFNILTVSYLVFCSFFNIGKTLKIVGLIWFIFVIGGIIFVLVEHCCVFTIICSVFTLLILIAMLGVILINNEKSVDSEHKITKENQYGAYVIYKTENEKFTFSFYDNHKHLVMNFGFYLNTYKEACYAINLFRKRGCIAKFEDGTKCLLSNATYPKFELHSTDNSYFYLFRCNSKIVVLKSRYYCKYKKCLKDIKKMMKILKTSKVFMSSVIVPDDGLSELRSLYLNVENNAQNLNKTQSKPVSV